MNLPNKLTLARVGLIPLCLLALLAHWYIAAAAVFGLAAFTDMLDGRIARKRNLVTNFGKFADPVADKILVLSAMAVLLYLGLFPWWALVIVLIRELAVDGLRLVAVEQGIVIAAGQLGKVKTTVQIIAVLCAMVFRWPWLTVTLSVAVCALTLLSGAEYFRKSKDLLNPHEG